ncbi:MAG: helix-turn-helix domain-containing protein [Actinoallomurus sp.]
MPEGKDYYTVREVADLFDVSKMTVYRWASSGDVAPRQMPGTTPGTRLRFDRKHIDILHALYQGTPPTPPQNGRTPPS